MSLGCLPWIVAIALLVGGGQSLYTGITNRTPTEIGISEFNADESGAKWLKVTGGELDVLNYAYTASKYDDVPDEVFIPLVPSGVDSTETEIQILYKTKEESFLEVVVALNKFEDGKDPTELLKFMTELGPEKLRPKLDVQGVVQYGINSDSNQDKVRELYDNLSAEGVVIEAGTEPSIMKGLVMTLIGLVVAVFMVRKMKPKEIAGPPELPQSS